jgi:hypothetical protein
MPLLGVARRTDDRRTIYNQSCRQTRKAGPERIGRLIIDCPSIISLAFRWASLAFLVSARHDPQRAVRQRPLKIQSVSKTGGQRSCALWRRRQALKSCSGFGPVRDLAA